MYIETLKLINFRNYLNKEFVFTNGVNIIIGKNGAGKTSILEAVYYLGINKSFRVSNDKELINFSSDFFQIFGHFYNSKNQKILVNFNCHESMGKKAFVNGEKLERLRDIVGKIPLVILSPEHENICSGTPSLRRKFVDRLLSIVDNKYFQTIISYRKNILERNKILKGKREKGDFDYDDYLSLLDENLSKENFLIYEKRKNFFKSFNVLLADIGLHSGCDSKSLKFIYKQSVNTSNGLITYHDFFNSLRDNFRKDIILTRTTTGVHIDRINILYGDKEIKDIGSQGEQKSALILIKLAEAEFIKRKLSEPPITLLDDLFAYLDYEHMSKVCDMLFPDFQFLITTTDISNYNRFEKSHINNVKLIEV